MALISFYLTSEWLYASNPSLNCTKSSLEGIGKVVKENKQATAGPLIAPLNPKRGGWAHSHQHVVSKETFAKVAHVIFTMLWQWTKRRHPSQLAKGVKKKDFQTIAEQNWVFFGEILGQDGIRHPIRLLKAKSLPITRHVKIQSEANPYDPAWKWTLKSVST